MLAPAPAQGLVSDPAPVPVQDQGQALDQVPVPGLVSGPVKVMAQAQGLVLDPVPVQDQGLAQGQESGTHNPLRATHLRSNQ